VFFEFRDFPHFADVYHAVSALIREPADVAELVTGAACDLAGQNVRYAELTVTPYTWTSAGMPVAEVTEALDIGAAAARHEHGVRIGYIFDIASELGGEAAAARRRLVRDAEQRRSADVRHHAHAGVPAGRLGARAEPRPAWSCRRWPGTTSTPSRDEYRSEP
jgi:aminodeoxyfutalosine deaminase